jgi:hypothetical protein
MQSLSLAHDDLQALPPQMYGEQATTPPGTHVPVPLQELAFDCEPLAHEGAVHCVPAT